MLQDVLAAGTINCVFAVIVLVSFLFALVSLLGAEIGDAVDFDVDADADTGFDFASVSPFSLAMFGATFGLVGLLASLWAGLEPIPSILVALAAGIVVGGLAQVAFLYLLSPSRSSHYSLADDAIGREAEVIITIPDDGLGQVAFNNVSGRVTMGARSSTGEEISAGDLVVIDKIVGRVAQVSPVSPN